MIEGQPAPRRALRLRVLAAVSLLLVLLALAALPAVAQTPSPGTTDATSPAPSPAATEQASPGASPAPGATAVPGTTGSPCPNPSPTPTPQPTTGPTPPPQLPALCPAEPKGADPFSLVAWLFTPIFQALFLALAFFYKLLSDIGLAIVAVTILIRLLLVPVFKAQIVSQRRMQLLAPEIRAVQQKFKGNRAKVSEETMRLYRERGVNPASGCLPGLLQLVLLIPMYSVFSGGLGAADISSMLNVFGTQVIDVACQAPGDLTKPCIDPTVHWLPDLSRGGPLNASLPEILFTIPGIMFGVSLLALISAALQLVQTRMMTPRSDDPATRSQQRIFLILPLFSIFYGSFLPSGLFIYWIVTTVFSIVQQYLIAGWGGLFPLFGWTPGFARDHTPRFAVPALPPRVENGDNNGAPANRRSATDRAAGTVRPARSKGRASRRGRRR